MGSVSAFKKKAHDCMFAATQCPQFYHPGGVDSNVTLENFDGTQHVEWQCVTVNVV